MVRWICQFTSTLYFSNVGWRIPCFKKQV
uniref:Uncharacterized protein n=1 Tax=Arundo donax TaxID=35708 RepID=A0A0A8Z6Q3_ARUDO